MLGFAPAAASSTCGWFPTASWTTGSLRDGKRIRALARVGEDATVVDGDKVRPYLLLATSYDLSVATIAQFTSIRVVCNNTLTAAVGDHGSRVPTRRIRG